VKTLLVALLLALSVPRVEACFQYVSEGDAAEHTTAAHFAQANEVVLVRLEAIREREATPDGTPRTMQFAVVRDYKGARAAEFELDMGIDIGCGAEYVEGREYVLYFRRGKQGGQQLFNEFGPVDREAAWARTILDELELLSASARDPARHGSNP
jgi:hypothetical protein